MKSKIKDIYIRLLVYAKPYKNRIIISMVASIGVGLTDATYAALVRPLVDKVIVGGFTQGLILVPIVVVGLTLFKGGARFCQEYFMKTAGQLAVQDIRNDLFRHIMKLSMRFYSNSSSGNLMSRVLNDVGVVQKAVSNVIVEVLRESVSLVALTVVVFYNDWKLACVSFLVIPFSAYPAALIGKKIKNYSRRGQQCMSLLTSVLQESFAGFKIIKSFGRESEEVRKFEERNWSFYLMFRKYIKYDSISGPVIEAIGSLGTAAVLWYGLNRVMSGAISQGALFSFIAALMMMYSPLKRLAKSYNNLQQAMASAERVFEIIDEPVEIQDHKDAVSLVKIVGEVEFDHVSFAYDQTYTLSDIVFKATPGEVVALVGPSGAGKTTFVGMINRFYDPTSGVIRIDGHDVRQMSIETLKRNIALVDQETFLFNCSIMDNIRYGRLDASDEDVVKAANLAYAHEFIEHMPNGYSTAIGDRGVRLSGGQRQRLCIARALLSDAPILILDEATSALDTESEAMVQKALVNLMKGRTTFIIAHRLSTIMHADKIVVLDNGKIVDIGTHEELISTDGVYRNLYEIQFSQE